MKHTKTKRSYTPLAALGAVSTGGLAAVAEWVGPKDVDSYYASTQFHTAAPSHHYPDVWIIPLIFVALALILAAHEFIGNRKSR